MHISELEAALLRFVAAAAAEGRYTDCYALGLSLSDITQLSQLHTMHHIDSGQGRSAIISSITICPDALTQRLDVVSSARDNRQMIDFLLEIGATNEMLFDLFGVCRNNLADRRQCLGIKPPTGRPPSPLSMDSINYALVTDKAASLLSEMPFSKRSSPVVRARVIIDVSKMCDVPLLVCWRTLQTAADTGLFNWSGVATKKPSLPRG